MMNFQFSQTCPQNVPSKKVLKDALSSVIDVLDNEDSTYRPKHSSSFESFDYVFTPTKGVVIKGRKNLPGSFLHFEDEMPTILVPDLHARYDFLVDILNYKIKLCTENTENSVLDLLAQNKIRIFFVGDGLHSERRGYERWLKAYDEFLRLDFCGANMTHEMTEGLNSMLLVMNLKIAFPKLVHFLKGNHENILNSNENGNLRFYKFCEESAMTSEFMKSYYGAKIHFLYANFESRLPLFVKGNNFLLSHAEPASFFTKDELINASDEVILGLTWTRNGQVLDFPAIEMLDYFFPADKNALYFAGHRPVSENFALRENGRFVQFHNPDRKQIILLNSEIDFPNNIIRLDEVQNG